MFNFISAKPDFKRIIGFLLDINDSVVPPLSMQVNLTEYAQKLEKNANFLFVQNDEKCDVGMIAYYIKNSEVFVTIIGLKTEYQGKGIGKMLFEYLVDKLKKEFKEESFTLKLEVHKKNFKAIKFYQNLGLNAIEEKEQSYIYFRLII